MLLVVMELKVYRLGPIAAFKKSAHSVSQIITSYYFAKFGIESYIYLRKGDKKFHHFHSFYGIEKIDNFFIRISSQNKSISSIQNVINFLIDVNKNKNFKNFIFLSKPKHVNLISKFKNFFDFYIIYENHTNNLNLESVKNSDLTYCVSIDVYDKLKDNKKVIFWDYHYPVSDKFFNIRKIYSPKRKLTAGYVGTLIKEKGIGFLIRTFKNKELNNFELRIIGGKDEEIKILKKYINDLQIKNKISFTGFLSQNKIIDELQKIDILIAPFTREQTTIPLKIYEYLATGIPVVSSNIPAVKCIGKDFINYFEPEDESSLLKTLKYVEKNYRSITETAKKAKKYAERFRWNNVIKKILDDLSKIN